MKRKFTPRGFEDFTTLTDSHGNNIVVRESSEVGEPRVWVFCHPLGVALGDTSPYLNAAQARALARGLLRFARQCKREAPKEEDRG